MFFEIRGVICLAALIGYWGFGELTWGASASSLALSLGIFLTGYIALAARRRSRE